MEKKFRKGEIVWAKVRGFPWWPAMVKGINLKITKEDDEEEVRETTLLVYFIGDDSHSSLPLNKVEKYAEKYEEYSRIRKRSLMTSIEIADKIRAGEIPFEKHLQYSKRRKVLRKVVGKQKENESEKDDRDDSSDSRSDSEEEREEAKRGNSRIGRNKFLGIKKKRAEVESKGNKGSMIGNANLQEKNLSNINCNSNSNNPQIDVRVKEDLSKNIKINININVNNNTSNTVNITAIGKKIIDDIKEDQGMTIGRDVENTEDNIKDKENIILSPTIIINDSPLVEISNTSHNFDDETKEELMEEVKEAISSLLFYKIEMPTSSSNKSILSALELIDSKLPLLKNCNIYTLIKDLIPILTSFLTHKNAAISTKCSELISIIKEKVLLEIFEFENEQEKLKELLRGELEDSVDQEFLASLNRDTDLCLSEVALRRNTSNMSDVKGDIIASELAAGNFKFRRNTRKASSSLLDQETGMFPLKSLTPLSNAKESFKESLMRTISEPNMKSFNSNIINNPDSRGKNINSMNVNNMNKVSNSNLNLNHSNSVSNFSGFNYTYPKQTQTRHHSNSNLSQISSNTSIIKAKAKGLKRIKDKEEKITKDNNGVTITNSNTQSKFNSSVSTSTLNKKKVPAFDSYQVKLLLNDFINLDEKNELHTTNSNSLNTEEESHLNIYSENFYQNVYNKYNGLSETLANKRKHVCLKLLNILKLLLPDIETETLKKTIINLEYNIRTKDPTLGNVYKKNLENFYDRIKEILSLTTESINMKIKNQLVK